MTGVEGKGVQRAGMEWDADKELQPVSKQTPVLLNEEAHHVQGESNCWSADA